MTNAVWFRGLSRNAREGLIAAGLVAQVLGGLAGVVVVLWDDEPRTAWAAAVQSYLGYAALLALVFVPVTILLLLVRGRRQSVIRWWVGAVALLIAFVVVLGSALTDRHEIAGGRACSLKALAFENDSVEDLGHSWWPPPVDCRFGWGDFPDTIERHWYWNLYVPIPIGLAVAATTTGAVSGSVRARRRPSGVPRP